jgi:hypothetical protein
MTMQLSEFKSAGSILTLEIRSQIRQERFDAICRDLDKATAVDGQLRLVLVMRHYPSFNSAEDFYDDLRFLRLYDHAIERVAVVCDRFWKDTWVGIFSLFSGIRMTFFEMTQIEDLTRWIQEG